MKVLCMEWLCTELLRKGYVWNTRLKGVENEVIGADVVR